MSISVALLDRDGTINVKAAEGDYIKSPAALQLLPGAADAISRLNAAGVPVVVVTNQRGIARGLMTEADLEAVHAKLQSELGAHGARIDAIFHCPHDVAQCQCRKPGSLMLEWARDRLGLAALTDAVMVGDAVSDIIAGQAVGARTVFLSDRAEAPLGAASEPSLLAAVRHLLDPAPARSKT